MTVHPSFRRMLFVNDVLGIKWYCRATPLTMEGPCCLVEKHRIHLSEEERGDLEAIVATETPKRAVRANILLLADEGSFGPGWQLKRIDEHLGLVAGLARHVVARATNGRILDTAMGRSGEALKGRPRPHGLGAPVKISAEAECDISAAFATGKFTKAELARRHGISDSTVARAIQRVDGIIGERRRGIPLDERRRSGPPPKLSDEEVKEIADALESGGFTKTELARRYGVCHDTINKSLNRGKRDS